MKKRIVIPIAILLFVMVVVILLLNAMLDLGYKINIVNGKPDGLVKYHDEDYYRNRAINGRAVVIRDSESRKVYKLTELGAEVNMFGYRSTKYTESTDNITYEINTGEMLYKLREYLEGKLSERTSGTVGHFDVSGGEISIVDSEKGDMFDIDAVLAYIALRVNYDEIVSVDLDEYIMEQESDITEGQDNLVNILKSYDNFRIEYTDGFVITKDVLYKYGLLKVNNDSIEIVNDTDKLIKMLVSNLVNYNSIGVDRKFHTHDDKLITVTGGTYGNYIDYSSEAEALLPMLKKLESSDDRVPVMKQEAKFSLDTTYIEVDKVKQHAYYFKDGELVLDTDVVTGKPTHDRETPSGVYFILNKTKDANLIGATWNVTSERWMGVTYQGVGFHDASWRSNFGGEIYKSNGSHGCINTPKDAMFQLYDMVEEGTPVIIY